MGLLPKGSNLGGKPVDRTHTVAWSGGIPLSFFQTDSFVFNGSLGSWISYFDKNGAPVVSGLWCPIELHTESNPNVGV